MKRIIYILLLVTVPLLAFSGGMATEFGNRDSYTKEMGDSAYSQRRFNDAMVIYEHVIDENGGSVELYYNLGNAAYRSNNLGKAILNYERALRMNPADEDVKANLEFVQSKIKDEVAEQYEVFFVKWMRDFCNLIGVDNWTIIGFVSFVMALLAILYILFNKTGKRNLAIAVIAVSLFVAIFANIAAYNMYNGLTDKSYAIIIKEEVALKSTPDNSGVVLIKVHEGRKVKIVDDAMKEWKEIDLEDGKIGWVKAEVLERI